MSHSHFKSPRKIALNKINEIKLGAKEFFAKAARAAKENNRVVKRIIVPLACSLTIVAAALVWSPYTLAVQVTYNGQVLGCVSDSSVFEDAMTRLKSSLSEQTDFSENAPTYNLAVVSTRQVETADNISESIATADGSLVEATGLYVDGELKCIANSEQRLQSSIDSLVNQYQSQVADGVAGVKNKIELSTAYYNADTVKALSLNNVSMSDLLTVKVTRTEVYTNELAFNTNTVTDNTKTIGYSAVTTEGSKGLEQITEEINYVNGEEVSRGVVDTTVLTEPVDRTVVIGSMSYSEVSSSENAYFSWPVSKSEYQYISAYWGDGRNHKGIDFAAPTGAKILAAASGKVISAGWDSSGYGYMIVIDHGDGYQTAYAHCNSIGVAVGQEVEVGQYIGAVGSTGNSTGPHLHFEVRINGVQYNPARFLSL